MIRRLLRWLALVPGRRVTVYLINGEIRQGRVWHVETTAVVFRLPQECSEKFCNHHGPAHVVRSRHDEGISWARGYGGPAVNALRTALTLRQQRMTSSPRHIYP